MQNTAFVLCAVHKLGFYCHLRREYSLCQTNIYLTRFYASAVEDFQEAREFDDTHEIREGLERAQKLLKISRKRDYYKILGVGR